MAKCPMPSCGKTFRKKKDAIDHLNRYHAKWLEDQHMDAAQALYFAMHGTLEGRCTCSPTCTEKTDWCYKTGKPYRISKKPECRQRVAERAKANLMNARGIDQHTLMTDMDHQRDMLRKKHTSGIYRFQTDGGKVEYSSSLEKDWLIFCDRIMELPSFTIIDPPESFQYFDPKANTMRWYTPDYYMPDYNLLIEIKDGGDMTNTNPKFLEETRYKVPYKDEAMRKQTKYNYIRISGRNYGPFVETLYHIVHDQADEESKPRKNLVVITESACIDPMEEYEVTTNTEEIQKDDIKLLVAYAEGTMIPSYVGITDSKYMASWIISNYNCNEIYQTSYNDPLFRYGADYRIYRYIGPDQIDEVFKYLLEISHKNNEDNVINWDLIDILGQNGIYFDDGHNLRNNGNRLCDFIEIERYTITGR